MPKNTTRVTITRSLRFGPVMSRARSVSDRDSQLDTVVGRIHQILLGTEIPLGRLNRCMAQEQLDLLKLAACGPAQLRAGPASVMRCDAGDAGIDRILPEHLPDHLFGHSLALHAVAAVHRAEYAAFRNPRAGG